MPKPIYGLADLFLGFSLVAVVFAAIGYLGYDLELASTQWLLVAAVLTLWAIYLKLSNKK